MSPAFTVHSLSFGSLDFHQSGPSDWLQHSKASLGYRTKVFYIPLTNQPEGLQTTWSDSLQWWPSHWYQFSALVTSLLYCDKITMLQTATFQVWQPVVTICKQLWDQAWWLLVFPYRREWAGSLHPHLRVQLLPPALSGHLYISALIACGLWC